MKTENNFNFGAAERKAFEIKNKLPPPKFVFQLAKPRLSRDGQMPKFRHRVFQFIAGVVENFPAGELFPFRLKFFEISTR